MPEWLAPFAKVTVRERHHGILAGHPEVGAGHAKVTDGVGRQGAHPVFFVAVDFKTKAPGTIFKIAVARDNAVDGCSSCGSWTSAAKAAKSFTVETKP